MDPNLSAIRRFHCSWFFSPPFFILLSVLPPPPPPPSLFYYYNLHINCGIDCTKIGSNNNMCIDDSKYILLVHFVHFLCKNLNGPMHIGLNYIYKKKFLIKFFFFMKHLIFIANLTRSTIELSNYISCHDLVSLQSHAYLFSV